MKKSQKEFLIDIFFTHYNHDKFAGWRGIADKLIDNGEVITTKQGGNIWVGGIGNFIEIEDAGEGFFECIKMTFDVNKFISKDNKYFLSSYSQYLKNTELLVNESQEKYENLVSRFKELKDLI